MPRWLKFAPRALKICRPFVNSCASISDNSGEPRGRRSPLERVGAQRRGVGAVPPARPARDLTVIDRPARILPAHGEPRSVVLQGTDRCPRCQLPFRWCVCAGLRTIDLPLGVDVLMHHMESYRPSSTGHLIERTVAGARVHLFRQERPLERAAIVRPDRELWILHPQGERLPAAADPAQLQVLLLDGTWVQATEMAHRVAPWGRRVRLPMTGESRYWLRTQAGVGKFSTVEALLFLLAQLGLADAEAALRAQFELHVWASLRARGAKERANEYLRNSPVPADFPELLARLSPSARDGRRRK